MSADTLHDRVYEETSIRKDPNWEGKYRILKRFGRDWTNYTPQRRCKFLWWTYWESFDCFPFPTEDKARDAIKKEIFGIHDEYLYQ